MALISRFFFFFVFLSEADAISSYSSLFRRPEGLYLTFPHKNRMEEDLLSQTKGRDIDLIVVSDSQAILGQYDHER
jgi:malate dehydrogenase (oxaloacetate-decarboxylating)